MTESSVADWSAGKEEHKKLSDAAAQQYDELYEGANFATGSYMRFELETIARVLPLVPSTAVAVDLGCGTGRDAFLLAKSFGQVYGYDFSPEMIRVANRSKLRRCSGNVLFEVLDVETDRLPIDTQTAGMVNSGFGMGSFLSNPEPVFREIRRILQPRGVAVFSFYNSEALVNSLTLNWRPALAARPVDGLDQLRVEFGDNVYNISARAYSLRDVRRRLEGNFRVVEILTFPTLTALFPNELFDNERARTLCTRVDQLLSANAELAAGPYIVAVCQKGGEALHPKAARGYARVLEVLSHHNIQPELRSHAPVRNMTDVESELRAPARELAKSVLIAADMPERSASGHRNVDLYLVAIPADRRVDMGTLAKLLDKKREQLRLATQVELEEFTGFEIGSVPPFGLPKNIPVIMDSRLNAQKKVWCGTGKATESMRISITDLKLLSTFTVGDISKPERPTA